MIATGLRCLDIPFLDDNMFRKVTFLVLEILSLIF